MTKNETTKPATSAVSSMRWLGNFTPPFRADKYDGWVWDANGVHVLTVRGWGHLTGGGALGLGEDEAVEIQDSFHKWVVETLNANLPNVTGEPRRL